MDREGFRNLYLQKRGAALTAGDEDFIRTLTVKQAVRVWEMMQQGLDWEAEVNAIKERQRERNLVLPQSPGKPVPVSAFLNDLGCSEACHYVVIVDSSISMKSSCGGVSRWDEARDAVQLIAPHACRMDPNGITLYLFHSVYKKWTEVTSEERVKSIFEEFHPAGGTDLTAVLEDAYLEYTNRKSDLPTRILVISDGEPNDPGSCKELLEKMQCELTDLSALHISFLQVGDDAGAASFMLELEASKQIHFVDIIESHKLAGLSVVELVQTLVQR
eukprot:NODE_3651_length_940_cov_27.571268_g3354_i0.p1 GENE.NODE_3651_length_940_cov_27.571268_g3354_i0~~NODE_3651_length_940_cov_27.571268_g3354_i0.p1  ORF type:complete len:274 (+),score=54.11 NODE_3651_length_940_cov_27.571268_g3354_i0:69-890(+)